MFLRICFGVIGGLALVSCSADDSSSGTYVPQAEANSVTNEQACDRLLARLSFTVPDPQRDVNAYTISTQYAIETWPKMQDGDLKQIYRDMSLAVGDEWARHMATIAVVCEWQG